MRIYSLNIAPRLKSLVRALEKLDSLSLKGPLEAGGRVVEGTRRLHVDYVRVRRSSVEALIRVSYDVGAGKCWSDVYLFSVTPWDNKVVILVRRVSGIGRTDPDFMVEELLRALTSEGARECEP